MNAVSIRGMNVAELEKYISLALLPAKDGN
jgi:hypothetical protein